MDDYYELLDIAPDAPRDDIRGAYRAKRDELQAVEGDGNRSQIAELNRAWNVLSDPAQRERYDERLAEHREAGEYDDDDDEYEYDDDDDDDADSKSRRPVPVTRSQRREEARKSRGLKQRTIVLPKGVTQASTGARLKAFAFDVSILIVIFLAFYVTGVRQVTNHYPVEKARLKVLNSQQKKNDDALSADKKAVSAADDKNDKTTTPAEKTAAAKETADKKVQDRINKEISKINAKLAPGLKLVYAIAVFAIFLYLVPSTAISGQTIGKRLMKIKVVNLADGSVPGWKTALLRFGVPLLVALILGAALLGPLGLVIALIGMVGWVTHPNQTGMHDRLAKTVVVDA